MSLKISRAYGWQSTPKGARFGPLEQELSTEKPPIASAWVQEAVTRGMDPRTWSAIKAKTLGDPTRIPAYEAPDLSKLPSSQARAARVELRRFTAEGERRARDLGIPTNIIDRARREQLDPHIFWTEKVLPGLGELTTEYPLPEVVDNPQAAERARWDYSNARADELFRLLGQDALEHIERAKNLGRDPVVVYEETRQRSDRYMPPVSLLAEGKGIDLDPGGHAEPLPITPEPSTEAPAFGSREWALAKGYIGPNAVDPVTQGMRDILVEKGLRTPDSFKRPTLDAPAPEQVDEADQADDVDDAGAAA